MAKKKEIIENKETKKNPVGRPKIKLDYETIEKLAGMMCTQEEIASYFDCDVRTLQRDDEFCRAYKKGLDKGRMSLRRKQYAMSETNVTMAIWLGKQYLGQTDKIEQKQEDKLDVLIETLGSAIKNAR